MSKHTGKSILVEQLVEREFARVAKDLKHVVRSRLRYALRNCPYCKKPLGLIDICEFYRNKFAHRLCFEEADKACELADLEFVKFSQVFSINDSRLEGAHEEQIQEFLEKTQKQGKSAA